MKYLKLYNCFVLISFIISVIFTGLMVFNDTFVSKVRAGKTIYVTSNATSIQDTIDNASSGDTIYVWGGIYYENVLVNKTVTLIGNGSDNTTIDGGGIGSVVKITANWVNISGFKLINSGKSKPKANSGIQLYDVENVTISNNNCSKNLIGIYVINSNLILIEKNICSDNDQTGIFLEVSNFTDIKNNTCPKNSWGIGLYFSKFNVVNNNTCNNNLLDGIQIFLSDLNDVINNICNSNDVSGICVPNSNHNKIINNSCNSNDLHGIILNMANLNYISNNSCNSNTWNGINLEEKSNDNNVKDNYCIKNYGGIGLYSNSNSNLISENNCFYNDGGIYINYSNVNRILKNNCNYNKIFGILSALNQDNSIENNKCNLNYRIGLVIDSSYSNKAKNNICLQNDDIDILLDQSCTINLSNNLMGPRGVVIDGLTSEHLSTHLIDTSNTVDGLPIYYWHDRSGDIVPKGAGQVFLAECENVYIENQVIQNRNMSIGIYYSESITIRNNSIENNYFGIYCRSSYYLDIYNNSCNQNYNYGIYLFYSNYNNVYNNTLNSNSLFGFITQYSNYCSITGNNGSKNGYAGFNILRSDKCNIERNSVFSNDNRGISLKYSGSNTIKENNIRENSYVGVMLNISNNNKIYHNNIIDNTIQATEINTGGKNNWDNGNGEGNFWSDYTGVDNGAAGRIAGDGIGDTKIPHLGLDNYPFINNSGWLYPGIPKLDDPGEFSPNGIFIISWDRCRGAVRYILDEDISPEFNSPIVVYNGSKLFIRLLYKPNGTYYYRLKAFSEHYKGDWSNIVDITVDWPPNPPTNLTVLSYPQGNALNISWDFNTIDTEAYEIFYKKRNMNDWEFLASITHPLCIYNHSDLEDGIEYLYKLKAIDSRGQYSEFSEILSGIPKDITPPAPPKGLTIVNITNYSISLSWVPNSETDVEGYNIYRYTTATSGGWGDLVGITFKGNETFIDFGLIDQTTYFYVITAFDEVPNESNFSNVVTGTTKKVLHSPTINNSISDFDMDEDAVDDSSIKLYQWFKDLNNDSLEFWCEGQKFINVTIFQDNGTVILRPFSDWYGSETLIFYASDGIFECFDDVVVSVNPINDPPGRPVILEPENYLEIYHRTPLNFSGVCTDADLPEDELTFLWYSNIQGQLGVGENLTNIELELGVHEITLTVSDKENSNRSTNITIYVLIKQPSPAGGDKPNDYSILIAGLIIFIIIILLLTIFIQRLRLKKEELSASSSSTPSRFSFLSLRVTETSDKVQKDPDIKLEKNEQKNTVNGDRKLRNEKIKKL